MFGLLLSHKAITIICLSHSFLKIIRLHSWVLVDSLCSVKLIFEDNLSLSISEQSRALIHRLYFPKLIKINWQSHISVIISPLHVHWVILWHLRHPFLTMKHRFHGIFSILWDKFIPFLIEIFTWRLQIKLLAAH